MKLGSDVRLTRKPFHQPSPRAASSEIGRATQRLKPAPAASPATSRTNKMVKMPSAPVAAPDERSNSPPIISSATATAMMPSGAAAWSRIDWAPLAWPNLTETAQKKTHTATAPMAAPISGRTSARWKTPRYASRSSAFGAALAPAVVSLIGDGSPQWNVSVLWRLEGARSGGSGTDTGPVPESTLIRRRPVQPWPSRSSLMWISGCRRPRVP